MSDTTVRVPLSFEDFQLIRNALAEADGALMVVAGAAGESVNQSGVSAVRHTIKRASAVLRQRAFPDDAPVDNSSP